MSSLDNIYQKMVPDLESGTLGQLHQDAPSADPQRQMSREVAHELNNILTILQGYTDRMVLRSGENAAMRADLQLISDNVRRAILVVRKATPRKPAVVPATATF